MSPDVQSTYRLQLTSEFGFDEAAQLTEYLAALGITHLYLSPCLQAMPGSSHGYDVVDHSRVSSELGGEEGFARLCAAAKKHSLGIVVDIVPNHMAIARPENRWWWDVLENGPSSRYASYFDVEWDSPEQRLRNIVLLPVLGDHYGRVLEAGELALSRSEAKFTIHYKDLMFPVGPRSLGVILASAALRCNSEMLSFIADGLENLPLPTAVDAETAGRRHRDKQIFFSLLHDLLAGNEVVARTVDAVIAEMNVDADRLDSLLERQNYRLAYWRTAERDLGYRRFFDNDTLAALRTENHQVFSDIHALSLRWVSEGWIDGLRIDHLDGLRDPQEYLQRLRDAAPHAWVVVEKILASNEKLPAQWPVAGTTGYEFLNFCNGLFVDPAGEESLTRFYIEFTGETGDYESICREKKRAAMNEALGSDLNRLTHLLVEVCERHRRHRDYTRHQLHEALREVIACLPVYRTYARAEDEMNATCVGYITTAIETARRSRPDLGDDLLDFLRDVLLRRITGERETEFVMRLQQFAPSVTAKGVEDTAFYCFNRLISLNEVGGNPGRFGVSPAEFFSQARDMSQSWPRTLLASSTHDTKRSEDTRARINLLSEIPDQWCAAVLRWSRHNREHWTESFVDRNLEYHFYQTLVGAWPIGEDRLLPYLEKAIREAKVHTSWTNANPAYETAVRKFATGVINDRDFIRDFEDFLKPLMPLGRINSLAQAAIKLTAPGVPDVYQGAELWNVSLVDPDNRRAVDYMTRRHLLQELSSMGVHEICRRADKGVPKLWLISRALHLRKQFPEVFGPAGEFHELPSNGAAREHVIAYCRGQRVVTVAPRLIARLKGNWLDTSVDLPGREWKDELSGSTWSGGPTRMAQLLGNFPVAILSRC